MYKVIRAHIHICKMVRWYNIQFNIIVYSIFNYSRSLFHIQCTLERFAYNGLMNHQNEFGDNESKFYIDVGKFLVIDWRSVIPHQIIHCRPWFMSFYLIYLELWLNITRIATMLHVIL